MNKMSYLQSKNEFILYFAMYSKGLHNAVINKDIQAIEVVLDRFTKAHLKSYGFSLYDSNTIIDIEYVYSEHMKELKEWQ